MAHSNMNGVRKVSRYHRFDDIPTNTFTPRTYQIQLLDAALKRNTLLCLGCPQSKVFLALMVAKELASPTRQSGHGIHKVTFYLTDSVEDVDALYETLPHHTDLQIGCCPRSSHSRSSETTEANPGTDSQEWTQLIEASHILICHGPVFLTAVQKNYVRLKDICLLIFDECHKSVEVKNHPYAEIVALVKGIPENEQPHILGVTASVAGTECSDPFKLQETISSMEKTMHAYAETSMLILSERFGCHPKEFVVRCIEYEYDDEQILLRTTLEDILEQNYDFFNSCQIAINDEVDNRDPTEIPVQVLSQCLSVLNILGTWCTSSISEYFVMQLDKIVKYEKNDIHKRFLRCVITSLRFLTKTFETNFHPDYDVDELLDYTTPKVRELIRVLRNYKPELDFVIISNDDSYNGDDFSDISDDDSSMSGSDDDESTETSKTSKPVHIAVKRTTDGGQEQVSSLSEEEEKSLCGIVFVENRYIAFGLNKVIEEVCSWDENLCFVKSCHITGQGLQGTNGKQKLNRTFKRQEEALRKFRTQECNLVIATLELEEGVDIPKCNLVVRFDPPDDYRAYTLSKGRARARDASYFILLDQQNYEQFESNLRVFKGIEQVLLGERSYKQAITSSTDKEDISDQDSDDGDNDVDDGNLLPPYCTIPDSPASPQVTLHGAIALINRYCAKLPSDAFTHLTPQCRLEKLASNPSLYVAFLRLPINSPIKAELKDLSVACTSVVTDLAYCMSTAGSLPLRQMHSFLRGIVDPIIVGQVPGKEPVSEVNVGPAMNTKKLAKMAVALKMCAILHKSGELDENLVPVGKEMFLYEEEEEWADEEDLTGLARPGTTKRKQYYVKKVADAVVQSLPKPGEPSYLYWMNLQLTGPITDEQNTRGRVIYAPEDTMQTLGVLVSKPIPQVPNFPVYTRSGEVTVSIDLLQNNLVLSEDEVARLLMFHHFVFSGVLHLEKDPMEFDPAKAECGLIVVPLYGKGQLQIEWSFVDKVIHFMKMKKHAGFSRKNPDKPFVFCVDEFKDAVVMPSYRNIDQPQHFYVAEILYDLNPLSPFPSPELYKTFQDYYTMKYGLVITNTEQPLLDVDHTSARLNLLTPRYMNQKGVALPTSSAETKRARRENLQQKQILVPELCDIHIFPASLWRKAVCLPAVLYRVNNLLLAEELRCKISKETGIGVEKLPEDFSFPKLDFGFETSPEKLKEAELISGKLSDQSSSPDVRNESFQKSKHISYPKLDFDLKTGQEKLKKAEIITDKLSDQASSSDVTKQTPKDVSFSKLDIGFETGEEKLTKAEIVSGKHSVQASSPDTTNESFQKRIFSSFLRPDFKIVTGPEGLGLKKAELISGKQLIQSSSLDSRNGRFQTSDCVSHIQEANMSTTSEVPHDLKHEHQDGISSFKQVEKEKFFTEIKQTVCGVFNSDEKTDSASSSDSDSGIASSGSDTNIRTKSTMARGSPEMSDVVPCESRARNNLTKMDTKISQCTNIPSCGSSDCNPTQQCSSHDHICNITSQGSSISNTSGNGFNQCNIIYTNEMAKPLYNSYLNGQPDGRSSTTSTSSVINSEHCIVATTSTTNTSLSSSSLSGISCSLVSSIDKSVKSTIYDKNVYEENTFTDKSITSTAAGASVSTPFSYVDDKLHATPDLAGATTNAAVPRPCSTSSSTKAELSASTTCLHASVPLKPCSLSDSGGVSQSAVSIEIEGTEGANMQCRQISSSVNKSLLSKLVPEVKVAGNSVSNNVPPSSSAASTEAQRQETPNENCSISSVELHDNKGCDFLTSLDSCPALLQEIHLKKAHEANVCDTCAKYDSNYKQDDIASVLNHHCVHNLSTPKIADNCTTSSPLTCVHSASITNCSPDDQVLTGKEPVEKPLHAEINCQHPKNRRDTSNGINRTHPVVLEPAQPIPAPCEKGSSGNSSIIMNTLGQELIGLDIDLIIPQAGTSETFHLSEHDEWGTKCGHKEHVQNNTDSWEGSCKNNVRDFFRKETFSQCPEKEPTSESQQSTAEESKTLYPDSSNKTDDDIIKFSFATDSLENGDTKKDFNVDTWMSETKESCKQTNVEGKGNVDEDGNASSLSSSAFSVPKTDQLSSMQAEKCKYAEFEIGVWSKRNKMQDMCQYIENSSSFKGRSLQNGSLSYSQLLDGQQQHVSLDEDRDLKTFLGPSPCLIMQALTMSNANDFFSLERLETIGDSFLKYAITVYLYCCYPGIHEGKLSYLRSKQVSNYNLYRLGRRKCLAESMVSTKFEPYENWLPPGYIINEDRRRGPVPKVVIVTPGSKVTNASRSFYLDEAADIAKRDEAVLFNKELEWIQKSQEADQLDDLEEPGRTSLVPYSLQRHHGLPDKSVADCVEALIGCYLTTCGRKAALMFMSWLGLKVLPKKDRDTREDPSSDRGSSLKLSEQEFDELQCPPSPMFSPTPENIAQLEHLLEGFAALEEKINYKFRDRSYLLQAFTHASYHYNTITDCYQRIEFLGDAILDYVITRHLYEDSKKYSPGILTDLRSALVNNNIFAALAVKWGFHKYFKAISPSLFQVIDKFVKRQKEKNQDDIDIDEEYRELSLEEPEPEDVNEDDDEDEEVEMEIPKALGDIFESVAGAIYLDSGMCLDTVWTVYYRMMKPHIDKYLKSIPKSPVRELLETEPETAKFERPERTMNGKVRVTVNVVGKGVFSGVGRNYRIAKSAAAKKALRSIRMLNQNLVA